MRLIKPKPVVNEDVRLTELLFNEIYDYKDVDILFLGSSQTYRGFDVRQFEKKGFHTFNMGTTAQTPVQTYMLMQQWIDSLCPRFVVMSVTPSIMVSNPHESTLDFIWSDFMFDKMCWELLKFRMCICSKSWYFVNTWLYNLYYHHVRNFICSKNTRSQKIQSDSVIINNDKYCRGGYVERLDNLKSHIYSDPPSLYKINPMQKKYLMKCINLLKQKEIPFLLVHVPVQHSRYVAWERYEDFEALFKKIAYVDYNGRVELNDTLDFYDPMHLNKYGVAKFDSVFISDLLQNKEFLDAMNIIKKNH